MSIHQHNLSQNSIKKRRLKNHCVANMASTHKNRRVMNHRTANRASTHSRKTGSSRRQLEEKGPGNFLFASLPHPHTHTHLTHSSIMKSGSVLLLTLATACLVLLLQSRGTHARAFDMNMLDERETAEGAFQKRDAALRNTLKSLIMRKNTDDRLFEPAAVAQKRGGSKSIDYAEDMVKFALWCRQMNIEC